MYAFSKVKIAILKPVIISLLPKPVPICHIGGGKARDVVKLLLARDIHCVLVLTSKGLFARGQLAPMLDEIAQAGICAVVYSSVTPDPSYTVVDECLALGKREKCEAVIAFGGGSTLDVAKVVAVAYTNKKTPRQLEGLLKVKKAGLPLIAVPTTAGTGSETTLAAVISDTQTHRKTTVVDPKIVPVDAVLDPELLVGLPSHITAQTAMDALTHALESYMSKYSTPKTRKWAQDAVKLIYENLEQVYENPADLEGRQALLLASFYAGKAFTSTYVGYVHAFAHNIGGTYGVSHGLCCAVLLPHVMNSYRDVCQAQLAELADLTGVAQAGDLQSSKSEQFVKSLFTLNKKLGIPERLEKFPPSGVKTMREMAFREAHGTYPVPLYYTKNQAEALLMQIATHI